MFKTKCSKDTHIKCNVVSEMAALRKDWDELNITRDEVKNIAEALKNDEFRKLLVDYVQETQSSAGIKKYQDDIIQLEADRGIDCTFVNPIPGFVVKTSVDGSKKAFINICSNNLMGKPVSKPMNNENNRGLSWSIPYSLSPARDDYDKKQVLCSVYDVIFHPDTLHLAHNNFQFRNLVIDTAIKGIEDNYHVHLDQKNYKLPKLKYKGAPYATVIRKKSEIIPDNLDENIEFLNSLNLPQQTTEQINSKPITKKIASEISTSYTTPRYNIKYRHNVDFDQCTESRTAKRYAAIPSTLIVEINLPLLNSTKNVKLDIFEKALELQCDIPVKYKLEITLPYEVLKDDGAAKFDTDRRILNVTLPVLRRSIEISDLVREDSGVESEIDESNSKESVSLSESRDVENDDEDEVFKKENKFLNCDIHYIFPSFDYNREDNTISFIINVKNVDPDSLKRKNISTNGFHLKFSSIGSGFYPIHYAFCAMFTSDLKDDILIEAWDNNITLQVQLMSMNKEDTIFVGLDEQLLEERCVDSIVDLSRRVDDMKISEKENDSENSVTLISADSESVVFDVTMSKSDVVTSHENGKDGSYEEWTAAFPKMRTYSEGSGDENPTVRRGILKNRSLSESCADDNYTHFPSGVLFTCSDSCITEHGEEAKDMKKTVRFSKHIQQQVFRANSSILGQRRKNQKRARNKRKAQERRASESENSEEGDERNKWTKQRNDSQSDSNNECTPLPGGVLKKIDEKKTSKKTKNLEFKSDLIHNLE